MITKSKNIFWLSKEDQLRIYGSVLPRNYYGETRYPHYIYFKQMIDGELHKFSTGETQIREALRVAPKMLKERLISEKPNEDIKYIFIDSWLKFKQSKIKEFENVKSKTIKVIETSEKKILPFWKNQFLYKLDRPASINESASWEAQFEQYVDWFRSNFKGQTMFNAIKYLNAYINWMHRNGLCKRRVTFKDPNAKLERKKRKTDDTKVLSIDEVISLLKHADPRQQLAILLGYFLAFRISDVVNLSWDRVKLDDPDDPYVQFLGDDKEETYAKAPLNKSLYNLFVSLKPLSNSEWVFPQSRNPKRPVNTQTLKLEEVFREAGLLDFSFHILRHTRLTLDFGNPNLPDSDVMIMRRVSLELALERYIHPTKDHRKRMATQDSPSLSNYVQENSAVLKLYEKRK